MSRPLAVVMNTADVVGQAHFPLSLRNTRARVCHESGPLGRRVARYGTAQGSPGARYYLSLKVLEKGAWRGVSQSPSGRGGMARSSAVLRCKRAVLWGSEGPEKGPSRLRRRDI